MSGVGNDAPLFEEKEQSEPHLVIDGHCKRFFGCVCICFLILIVIALTLVPFIIININIETYRSHPFMLNLILSSIFGTFLAPLGVFFIWGFFLCLLLPIFYSYFWKLEEEDLYFVRVKEVDQYFSKRIFGINNHMIILLMILSSHYIHYIFYQLVIIIKLVNYFSSNHDQMITLDSLYSEMHFVKYWYIFYIVYSIIFLFYLLGMPFFKVEK